MKIGANLTWLFTEYEFLSRPAAAKAAGFDAVEVLFPYETPATALADAIATAGLTLALINTPPTETTGRAALPDQIDAFRTDFARATDYARAAGSPMLHVMAGVTDASGARETLVATQKWAAALVAEIDASNLGLQFDVYHAQMIHGDALKVWQALRPLSAHAQIAAAPDRTEPDATTLDVIARLKTDGYVGTVSAEYGPRGTTAEGLGWLSLAKKIAASEGS